MNNILIDCLKIRGRNTGLFHFCLQLGAELIRQADPGREALCFYVPKPQQLPFGPAPQYLQHRHHHKYWFAKARKFDLWHSTFQNSRYLPRAPNTRMLLTIHDLNFLIEEKSSARTLNSYLRRVQAGIDRADQVVCVSNYTLSVVNKYLRLGGRPVEVIYNGCNINEFPAFDTPRYRPAGPFVFTVGTVLPKKNFHVLPCLLKGNDLLLLIAGPMDAEYSKTILAEARQHGVESRVRLLGPVTEEEKSWYFRECLAFAFPSIAEGFGLPVVEAMHYGKPIFLSDQAALPEIGGEAAYYFSSFDCDAMRQVFQEGMVDYGIGGRSERIRRRALDFRWEQAAANYLRLYRQWD